MRLRPGFSSARTRRTTSSTAIARSSQSGPLVHRLGDLAQGGGARVVGPVDAVAEAHDPAVVGDRLAGPGLGVVDRADLVELADDLRRGAPVERALECADRAADRRGEVRAGRRDHPGGERRGVQAVLGADDEIGLEGTGRGRIRAGAGQLLEEAAGEVEGQVGLDRLEALAQPAERGQRRRRERRSARGPARASAAR